MQNMKSYILNLKPEKLEPWIFMIMVAVHLIPVFANTYFVTGDGPCHIYNAKVLLDYWTGQNQDFYKTYYDVNYNLEPNYFSSYFFAFLLSFLPDYIAEKVFLTTYILAFSLSIRWVLGQLNPSNKIFALAGLPFIYQKSLQMGFFNYSMSIALMFLILAFWLYNRKKFTPLKQLILSILGVLMFFTHGGGLTMTIALIAAVWIMGFLSGILKEPNSWKTQFPIWKNEVINLFLCFLPAVLLLLGYQFRKGLNPMPGNESFVQLKENLFNLTSLVNLSGKEEIFASWYFYLITFFLISGLILKIILKRFSPNDVFLFLTVFALYLYFNMPSTLAGGTILSIRFQCIPYLMLILWLGSLNWHNYFRWMIMIASCFIGIGFITVRQPIHRKASEGAVEYTSVRKLIEDRSTVLPISFSHNGRTPDGNVISDRIWLFMHAGDYIGTDKSLVMLGNYEAYTGYFPFTWSWHLNPYKHLPVDGRGFEDQPPNADILGYPAKSEKGQIDYVVTWCLDDSAREFETTKNILLQLEEAYDLIYTSSNGLAMLYKLKSDYKPTSQ